MSRYDWLREQVKAVPRETFFTFTPVPEADLLRLSSESGALPEDYLEFAREFGSAQLFRCLTSTWHHMYVNAPPDRCDFEPGGPGEWPGGVFLMLGARVNSGPIWLPEHGAGGGAAAGLLAGHPPYLRRSSASFAEWLRRSFDACRKLYTRREWGEVMTPVAPFTPDELRIVEARQRFMCHTLNVSGTGVFSVEVTNGSDMELPWLTVGIDRGPGQGMGYTCLPVHRLAPGQVRVVEWEVSGGLRGPRRAELVPAPPPHPEDRGCYWEFSGPPEGWRRGQPWPPKGEGAPHPGRSGNSRSRARRPPQKSPAGPPPESHCDGKSAGRASPDPAYGPWKFIHEIELADLQRHPVWLWCMQLGLPGEEDGPLGGDETAMRPLLASDEVPLDHTAPPLILLRVQGTPYHASGLYGAQGRTLEAISVFVGRDVMPPAAVADLPDPTVYAAVPAIGGQRGVVFQAISRGSGEARQQT